jgi:hypothetical protein
MELPEKAPIGDQRRYLLYILKHISKRPVIKGQGKPRDNAQEQTGKTQAGKITGYLLGDILRRQGLALARVL